VSIIGAGYDPFAGYASPNNVVAANIFDWKNASQDSFKYLNKTYKKPVAVSTIEFSDSSSNIVTGQDIQTYQENLSVKVDVSGSYGFFSGSVSTEFHQEALTKSECEFSRFQKNIATWGLKLTLNSGTRELLDDTFRSELDSLDASNADKCSSFFSRYGSHILTGIVLGGRALQTASTNKYTVDKKYSLSVTAQQAFRFAVGEASASEQAQYATAVSSFTTNSIVEQHTTGGNPALGDGVFRKEDSTLAEWSKSVVEDPIFVDFTTGNPFTPIWELCADNYQGQEVRSGLSTYYENYWVPENTSRRRLRPDYIDALSIVVGSSSTIPPTEGYTKVNYDLNRNAGGKWIFLCYHKASYNASGQIKPAITDVVVVWDEEPTPPGYTRIQVDLNANAGGKWIYLCYKIGDYDPDTAILDVTVFGGDSRDVVPPYGFTKLDRDVNAGAKGDFIFLGYAKRTV
jgi:hypothetical protein